MKRFYVYLILLFVVARLVYFFLDYLFEFNNTTVNQFFSIGLFAVLGLVVSGVLKNKKNRQKHGVERQLVVIILT